MPLKTLGIAALLIASASVSGLRAQASPAVLTVTSTAFKNGDALPIEYTADGRNVSPPLAWSGAPASTREFALILDDPDAPTPLPFVHWVIYKIPAKATGLPEALSMGSARCTHAEAVLLLNPAIAAPPRRRANRTITGSSSLR